MSTQLTRHRFTADEYHQMAEAGVLRDEDRVELIEGEIVDMTPIGLRHSAVVNRLNRALVNACGDRAIVQIQAPGLSSLQPRPASWQRRRITMTCATRNRPSEQGRPAAAAGSGERET